MAKSPHWGRRKRRLRRMALLLTGIAVAGAIAGVLIYRATRPDIRRPGEELPEITAKLARNLPAEAPMPRLTDVTEAAGLGGFRSFVGERTSQLPEDMGSGLAWGDFDNDGDDDLFLVSAGGALGLAEAELAPSRLYENLGGGAFRPAESFPDLRIRGMGAAWGDYDGDGWLDLVVSGYHALRLFHNEGGERFVAAPALPAPADGYWSGVSWADFDGDRDVDLYVCGYVQYVEDAGGVRKASEQYGTVVPYTLNPASFEPASNLLLRNEGGGRFRDVAELWGVSNPEGRSLGALWHDFDADGLLDLYVANDISDNALYLNRGETFDEVGLAAWVADYRGAMGLTAGDWNRDGDDDLFITHWIAQENALYDSRLVDMAGAGAAGGAAPQITFTDQASPLGLGQIAIQSVGWGTEFADLDADGWLDLVVANGSTLETADEPKRLKPQPLMLFWNQQGHHFHDLAPLNEELAAPRVGRGLALSDYDGDGDLDLAVMVLYEGVKLYRNDLDGGNWLEIRLRSRGPSAAPGFGEGSSVELRVGEHLLRRSLTRASYLSQSSRLLHFGLGEAGGADSVEVRWHGGATQSFGSLAAGAVWELTEGEAEPRRVAAAAAAAGRPIDGDRERLIAFWAAQRAAMDAFKIDADCARAVPLFREALALDPTHEDSRYYLANCLAGLGDPDAALAELDALRAQSPMSHRAHKQWGVLRAIHGHSDEDLAAAQAALERALEINREETGSLLVLGEIALLRGEIEAAEHHLSRATTTNPRAVGGFFLRGYMAWRRGDEAAARELLETARAALGPDWKPQGTTAEGDVAGRQHREETPLSRFWESWDGTIAPGEAFAGLDARL